MKKFLDNLKPENTFICFTHCDLKETTEKLITSKLASIKKYCKLEIPNENIIKFANSVESLQDFVENFVKGEIVIADELDVKVG